MCDPVSISLALASASAGTSVLQQKYAADAAEASQESAIQSAKVQANALNERVVQEREAAGQQIQQRQIEGIKARARARASAAEAGVTGLAVEGLIRDLYRQESVGTQAVRQNLANTEQQVELEKKGVQARTQGQVNQLQTPAPNFATAALRIGSAVTGAYWGLPEESRSDFNKKFS